MNICCIGAGYVGGPTMAMIAARRPEIPVTVVDVNESRIAAWNSHDSAHLRARSGLACSIGTWTKPVFLTDIDAAIRDANMIFVSVTRLARAMASVRVVPPTSHTSSCARAVLRRSLHGDKIVIEKSTLPVCSAESLRRVLHANGKGHRFEGHSPTRNSSRRGLRLQTWRVRIACLLAARTPAGRIGGRAAGGDLFALGASRAHPHDQRLVKRVVEAGRPMRSWPSACHRSTRFRHCVKRPAPISMK